MAESPTDDVDIDEMVSEEMPSMYFSTVGSIPFKPALASSCTNERQNWQRLRAKKAREKKRGKLRERRTWHR